LNLLSVVIPARDEEGCIARTVEHLDVELRHNNVPHEIVVVDDGSSDRTWAILEELRARVPGLKPVKNTGAHGFGRAVICGSRPEPRRRGGRRWPTSPTTAATSSATGRR
jgi:dolichol-phosphate mannosyltransferase